jgi:hypothetical protein
VPTPPLDLVEYEGRPPFADFKPVCMDDYIKSYKKRWAFRTSIGDVVLKKLTQLDRDRILTVFFEEKPELIEVLKQAEQLRNFERRGIPLDAAHIEKMESCGKLLRDQQRLFSMACFENPKFVSLEDYDAFLTALDAEEVTKLYVLLSELTSVRSATASCEILLTIAKEYGIPLSKDLTIENMTAEQADILVNTLEKKGELMKREMDKIAE